MCVCCLFLSACSSDHLEDIYQRGQVILTDMCKELHEVHSFDDLEKKSPYLKKKMRKLTRLMIQAEHYHRKHPHRLLEVVSQKTPSLISDKLHYEILRICEEIDGSQALLEVLQEEMLDKLDLNERKRKGSLLNRFD